MQLETISFIVPCYNAAKTLSLCLESLVKSQKHFSLSEIIVVDNGSTDESIKICEQFPVTLLHETKRGRSYARNCGAAHSKTKWLAFVDADVVVDESWAITLVHAMNKWACTGAQGRIIPSQKMGSKSLNDFRYQSISLATQESFQLPRRLCFESPMINSAACIYERELFMSVNGFDPLLERHEDIDLSKRIFMAGGDLYCSDEAHAEVIYHGDGWWDYTKRSFADGRTKMAYFEKWSMLNDKYHKSEVETSHSHFFYKLQLTWAEAKKLTIHAFKSPTISSLMMMILFVSNHWGKLIGMFQTQYTEAPKLYGDIRNSGRIYHGEHSYELRVFMNHESFKDYHQMTQGFIW